MITLTRHNIPMSDVEYTEKEDVFFAIDEEYHEVFFTVKGSNGITETNTDAFIEDNVRDMIEYNYSESNTEVFNTIDEFEKYIVAMLKELRAENEEY